jgi:hypothetical protein
MFRKLQINRLVGWLLFGLSFIVYLVSMSKTVNFWDCGEIIACSDGLQIGHPPGAPFYMIMARVFLIFAFNPENTAFFMNLLSVISATFAVFITYHTLLLLFERISTERDNSDNKKKYLKIFAAAIGSLSLAFSTSYWTVATETEVYSVSILFTSLTFWTMLKSTTYKNQNDKNRWLILTALLIGMSTGIHLLNILVIPALVLVYYFDQIKQNKKEFLKYLLLSVLLLLVVQLMISYLPVIASKFEWFFVNNLYLGFNLGLIAFSILIIFVLVLGIVISGRKGRHGLNLAITCFAVFLIGFSSYSIVLIRSAANPPIDQNNPESIFNFVSYLNREQYGNRPLLYGQQFNSEQDKIHPYVEGDPVYDTVDNKYKIIAYKPEANYVKRDKTWFPRMWSNLPEHVAAYREWTGYKKDKIPPFGKNVEFMFRYQFNHMYFRYFMWNFVGKQNDFQSYGGPINGNWISGIEFIDNLRLKNTSELPPFLENNKARNVYYLLPLLIGIIGFFYLFRKDKRYFLVTSFIFIFTGIAIVFYLNQHPYQARERDYSYLGSFYAFSIWIGYGVIAIYEYLKTKLKTEYLIYIVVGVLFVAVPGQFLVKNFNDHNRNNDDFAYYFAYNLLNTCAPNAILFTSGDNETFPLWYLQETQNIRTDVRIVNLSFLNTDWYIDQIQTAQRDAMPVSLSISRQQYISGQRELLLVRNNPYAFIEDIYYENINEINADYQAVFNFLLSMWQENGFDQTHSLEYNNFVNFYSKIQAHGANQNFRDLCGVINSLETEEQCSAFGLTQTQANDLMKMMEQFLDKQVSYPLPLHPVLNFAFSNDSATKINTKLYPYPIDYFPAEKLSIAVNKNVIDEVFEFSSSQKSYVVDKMIWSPNHESLTKSDLMVFEIIRSNLWKRPIYFTSTMNSRNYLGLNKYLFLEGLAYRLMPIETDVSEDELVNVNAGIMYQNLMTKFEWGSLQKTPGYIDEATRTTLINLRNHFSRLARGLYFKGEIKQSEDVLDLCVKLIPDDLISFDYYSVGIVHGYYRINKKAKAREIATVLAQNAFKELEFYSKFSSKQQFSLDIYKQRSVKTIEELYVLAEQYKHKGLLPYIGSIYEKALALYDSEKIVK